VCFLSLAVKHGAGRIRYTERCNHAQCVGKICQHQTPFLRLSGGISASFTKGGLLLAFFALSFPFALGVILYHIHIQAFRGVVIPIILATIQRPILRLYTTFHCGGRPQEDDGKSFCFPLHNEEQSVGYNFGRFSRKCQNDYICSICV